MRNFNSGNVIRPCKVLYLLLPLFLGTLAVGATDSQVSDLVYSGKYLKQLRIPVGGVGTGNLLIGGRGDIQHIEVFNRPDRSRRPVYTFFTIRVKAGDGPAVSKILERELLPPFNGVTHRSGHGLPRFDEVVFSNHFPVPKWEFQDEEIPLRINLEAINPFIPTDLDSSSFPLAAFYWQLENSTSQTVEVSLALSMENSIRAETILNEAYRSDNFQGVRFSSVDGAKADYQGAILFGTTIPDAEIQTHWYDGRWRDDLHIFWDDFSQDGSLTQVQESWTSTYKPLAYNEVSNRNSTVLVRFSLEPGESKRIPFYLSWYFPKRQFTPGETFGNREAAATEFTSYYSTLFTDEGDALAQYLEKEDYLVETTRRFARALQDSTLPDYVTEALITQAATLKTNLIQITKDGDPHGFEGVNDTGWCCPGTCTHVWNYEQALASLFPGVERRMREIEFLHDTFENGFQTHRSLFPLGDYWFDGPPAADGQMGTIVRTYREWMLSGDNAWLESIWPKVKQALRFAWNGSGTIKEERFKFQKGQTAWDPDRTGLMTGRQHNTYDISFFGPNSMTSSLYLAALKAGSRMAEAMGEPELAHEFTRVYQSGVQRFEKVLWNGDYFIQIIENDPNADASQDYEVSPITSGSQAIPKYQYGDGCLSDQLLGQYLAHVSGLGYILDPAKVDHAMKQIYEHNFIRDLSHFSNVQRVYALNEESGVVLCTWPKGNRPLLPFVYSDEIWSGVEFQVAASLIYSGHVQEGLDVVRAIQERHDGYKRNPFEHDESGVHYARAMASWSVLLALSGFNYNGVEKALTFTPRLNPDNFTSFWSTGKAWGTFSQVGNQAKLSVFYGSLDLKRLNLDRPITQTNYTGTSKISGNTVKFPDGVRLKEGETLEVRLQGRIGVGK
ncbi:MAG: hypothetical protein KJT03_05735 [Verrucomicrobiae bacterium]|nr:hypothetical protein [Verrucomicrobiae bacterium]